MKLFDGIGHPYHECEKRKSLLNILLHIKFKHRNAYKNMTKNRGFVANGFVFVRFL